MSEDYNDDEIKAREEEAAEEDEELMLDEGAEPSGKFDKLLNNDSQKYKLSGMFRDWFLDYSSYVILARAVPHIVDGLKPVQRRVLHSMFTKDDGSLTKVANLVGEAMKYHPHGDASILGALVQLGQKGYLIDCQGNWGNIFTGDGNAAPRYIEARLSKFAKEVIFDPKITNWMTSYDGRNQEPTELPVRFPLLLAQGTEGIAVGMASKILPHNFNELLDASIAILEDRDFELYPDFPTGGLADCSKYMKGHRGGVVKVRARIEKIDKNTIAITEIPYGKTTHTLSDSILKARKKGKLKFRKLMDMTTATPRLVISLPNDVSPDKTIDALYAFTDCETTISPNACVIKEDKPQFLDVDEILRYDTYHTRDLLEARLQISKNDLEGDWHYTSLERIFFENRVYKILEHDELDWDAQLNAIFSKMKEYQDMFHREIVMEDILRLVEKPVRKISKTDTKALDEKILAIEDELRKVQDNLDHITRYTIDWFKYLKKKYGKDYPRLTELTSFESIAVTKVINNNAKLYADKVEGFVGMELKKDENVEYICDCSDMSEIIVIAKDGKYMVTKITDKAFFWKDLLYVGVFNRNDSRTIYNVIYRDGNSAISYAKRFAITSVTRDKEYNITTGESGSTILWFSANPNGEAETVKVYLRPRAKLKKSNFEYDFSQLGIKGKTSRGNLVSKNPIQKIQLKARGVSTIAGKDIWFDPDIQKLNEDGRGQYLGQFDTDDKILAVFKNGTYYTTSFDLVNRYQGELLLIEKYNPDKVFTALYWDAAAKSFYIKRFSFSISDNTPVLFIAEGRSSYLVDLNWDERPQIIVEFGGKWEFRQKETINVEEFIAKKGIAAKGKKVHSLTVKKVYFTEPLEPLESAAVDREDAETASMNETAPATENIAATIVDDTPEADDGGEELTLF